MWERSLFYISFFLICFHAYTNIMNNKKRGLKSFQSYCVLIRYYSALILHELNIIVKSHSNTESRSHDIWKRWLKMSKLLKDGDMLLSWAYRMSRTMFASSDLYLPSQRRTSTSVQLSRLIFPGESVQLPRLTFPGKSKKHLYCFLVFAFKGIKLYTTYC